MKWNRHHVLDTEKKEKLERYLFAENIQRSRVFAKIVVAFESLLIAMNLIQTYAEHQTFTNLNNYFFLYVFLLVMCLIMLSYTRVGAKIEVLSQKQLRWYRTGLEIFVIIFLSWGAVVTLLDQQTYGHVMAFAVGFMCVSILYQASTKVMLGIYILPVFIMIFGMPYFQKSGIVLFGHYTNLALFLVFCWIASRMLYHSYSSNYISQLLLQETNESLALQIEENKQMNEKLRQLTILDELTHIPNRRGFQEYMEIFLHSRDHQRLVTIMVIDIDGFKLYNDHYGHLMGDRAIQSVASVLKECTEKSNNLCARFGGEEFIVAAFDLDEKAAIALAEDIRNSVMKLRLPHDVSPFGETVTVSVGIAITLIHSKQELQELIAQSDTALYEAKKNGRNRVCLSREMRELSHSFK